MKKKILSFLILYLLANISFSQQEKAIIGYENWLNNWTSFKPNTLEYDKPSQILSGNISKNINLAKDNIYLLLGDVFVTNGASLTVEPGTVILGDFKTKGSLTISKGSKIIAEGSNTDPIIFTSNRGVKQPGDWGGIFILGNAPINNTTGFSTLEYGLETSDSEYIRYGGDSISDSSGVLKFVRIEYAGKRTKDFGNFNALTLAGVGNKTVVENVMVSFSKGNSYKILGGDIILTKLVSYKTSNTDFVFNYGTQSKLKNSLAVRSPYVSGMSNFKCIELLNSDEAFFADSSKKNTTVEAENLTLVNISNTLESDMKMGLVKEAIYVGKDVDFKLDKSVISGFKPAVIFDNNIKLNNESLQNIQFVNTLFNSCDGNIFLDGNTNNEDLEYWYGNRAFNNLYSTGSDAETFIDVNNLKRPDFRLIINKIIEKK